MTRQIENQTYPEKIAQTVISQLKEGKAPWQRTVEAGQVGASFNPISNTVYKGVNIVQLTAQGFDDPRWMTIKQANEANFTIKENSNPTQIVHYRFTDSVDKHDAQGQPILNEDGTVQKKTIRLESPIINMFNVFNAEQIEGIPALEKKEIDWNPEEKAEKIIANSRAVIVHDQQDKAFYRHADDSIHLPEKEQFSNAQEYYGAALREISRSTGHRTRMNRGLQVKGTENYAKAELRTEISSWMISQETGIAHKPNVEYVGEWIKILKNDPIELMRACNDAEKIKEYVMGLEHNKELAKDVTQELSQDNAKNITKDKQSEQLSTEKTYLDVPYEEKEQAKKFGAKWDFKQKAWFAPEGSDLEALKQWLPENVADLSVPKASLGIKSPENEFAQKLEDLGLDLKGNLPILDGKIHRVPLIGRSGQDGAYCLYNNTDIPAGWAQNHVTGEKTNLIATGHVLTLAEKAKQKTAIEKLKATRTNEISANKDKVALNAQEIWKTLEKAPENHPYLENKNVLPFGLKQGTQNEQNDLIVPLQNIKGEIRGLQIISEDGSKRFMTGMEKTGNFHMINPQNVENTPTDSKNMALDEIIICEGYATGASLHMATEKPVAIAFDAGNLEPVAKNIREKFPNAKITICADHDHKLEAEQGVNVGKSKAEKAALAVGGKVKMPILTAKDKKLGLTDFNDIHKAHGLKAMQKQMGVKVQQQKALAR